MKKVFVFIGSQKGKASNTAGLTQRILDNAVNSLQGTQEELEIDFYTAKDVNIKSCKSCLNCFNNGFCPLDKTDDMAMLKAKMLEADFIILGSPVYAHNVSGDMKKFIDRISNWTHLMKLAGKAGIIVSTTLSNGNMFVLDYLYKIMSYLGIKVVGKFSANIIDYIHQDIQISQKEISNYAGTLADYIQEKRIVSSDDYLERLFNVMKQNAIQQKAYNGQEYLHWKESGYLDYYSFDELLQHVNSKAV